MDTITNVVQARSNRLELSSRVAPHYSRLQPVFAQKSFPKIAPKLARLPCAVGCEFPLGIFVGHYILLRRKNLGVGK